MRTIRFHIISAIILCSMIPACTRKRAWTGPKFSGHLMVLAQDWDLHSDLIEITPGPNSTYNQTVITSDVFYAAASPDQTRLLYSTRDGLFLRDLRSGVAKQVVPLSGVPSTVLAWSPDNNRFAFRASKSHEPSAQATLYVSDLDGKTKLIWESWVGGVPLDRDVFWIAPDRLIFDRVLRHTPKQEEAGEVLLENTTTVAILGDPVKFEDTDKQWSIDGVCQFGNAAVLTPQHKDYPVFITKNLDNLAPLNPARVCVACRFAGFAAKSCLPFFLESDNKTSTIYSLHPSNWQIQNPVRVNQPFSVVARTMINSSGTLMVVGSGGWIFLVDTGSGNVEQFFPNSFSSTLNKRIISVEPVVWLEN